MLNSMKPRLNDSRTRIYLPRQPPHGARTKVGALEHRLRRTCSDEHTDLVARNPRKSPEWVNGTHCGIVEQESSSTAKETAQGWNLKELSGDR